MSPLPPCVVLGGGTGSRMRPATETLPKPLLAVGGEPFAVHQLRWIASQGVSEVIYSVGYLGHMIREALGSRNDLGCTVRFVDEGAVLRGTGGAVRLATTEAGLDGAFLVLYGDSYLQIDVADVWETFEAAGTSVDALMTVFRNEGRWERCNAEVMGDRVLRYDKDEADPQSARMQHVDYGLSILRAETVTSRLPDGPSDLATLLRDLSIDGRLGAYEAQHRFYEIGSPAGLADLVSHLGTRP